MKYDGIVPEPWLLTFPQYKEKYFRLVSIEHGVSMVSVREEIGENSLKADWRKVIKAAGLEMQLSLPVLKSFARVFGAEDYLSTFRGRREQKQVFDLTDLRPYAIKSPEGSKLFIDMPEEPED